LLIVLQVCCSCLRSLFLIDWPISILIALSIAHLAYVLAGLVKALDLGGYLTFLVLCNDLLPFLPHFLVLDLRNAPLNGCNQSFSVTLGCEFERALDNIVAVVVVDKGVKLGRTSYLINVHCSCLFVGVLEACFDDW